MSRLFFGGTQLGGAPQGCHRGPRAYPDGAPGLSQAQHELAAGVCFAYDAAGPVTLPVGSWAPGGLGLFRNCCVRSTQKGEDMAQDEKPEVPPELLGKVEDVAGLIDYQQGAVVSRTVINKKVGTVTVFAFDKGQGLSEHTAPFDALVHVLDGRAEVAISGRPLQLKSGEMVIMPANEPHALRATERFKMMLVMIRS